MSAERWLVAVCAGRWQLQSIRAAKKAGLRVLALDGDPKAPGLTEADLNAVVDIRDPQAVLAAVRSSAVRPAGAISFVAEAGMNAAAAVRKAYGLPGPDENLTTALTNKLRQREAWTRAGVPGPRWERVRTIEEAGAALERIGLPAVIKPVDCAGSRGVFKVEPGSDWQSFAKTALSASASKTALVESHMPGTEYTVETFAAQGRTHVLAVTGKTKVPGTGGTVANELATPDLPEELVSRVADAAVQALTALGHTDGPGHTEIILSPEGRPGLVESAGRGGGFMVFDLLVPRLSGFDIATACALQAAGLPAPEVRISPKAGVLRFFPSRPGMVRSIRGFEEACALEGVRAGPFVSPGEQVNTVKGDGDRMGYIFAEAPTPRLAQALADKAESMIHFEVTPQ
ncbi:MAG: ATP-grasp domain-containing protein [Elusimicrobiota bacterium]